jgi:hypothetical protein
MDQQLAKLVIDRLNSVQELSPGEKKSVLRVEELLTLLGGFHRRAVSGESIHGEELVPLNALLSRYTWFRQVLINSEGGLYWQNEPVLQWVGHRSKSAAHLKEQYDVDAVINLINADMLDLIRRCDYCHNWYLAKRHQWRPSGSFCSQNHQVSMWRSKPENQKKRTDWQRKYYRTILSPVTGRRAKLRKKRRKS